MTDIHLGSEVCVFRFQDYGRVGCLIFEGPRNGWKGTFIEAFRCGTVLNLRGCGTLTNLKHGMYSGIQTCTCTSADYQLEFLFGGNTHLLGVRCNNTTSKLNNSIPQQQTSATSWKDRYVSIHLWTSEHSCEMHFFRQKFTHLKTEIRTLP